MPALNWEVHEDCGYAIGWVNLRDSRIRVEVYRVHRTRHWLYSASIVSSHGEPSEVAVGSAESLSEAQRFAVSETRGWLKSALEALSDEPEND